MEHLHTLTGGYSVDAAATGDGWIAAALVTPDLDAELMAEVGRGVCETKPGVTVEQWRDALIAQPRTLVLIDGRGDSVEVTQIAQVARIDGPVVCGGEGPAVAWTQREGDRWAVCLWRDGEASAIYSERMASQPSLSLDGEQALVAWQWGNEVQFADWDGGRSGRVDGRNPHLAGGWMVVERTAGGRSALVAVEIATGREVALPAPDDLNFNPSPAIDPADGSLWVAWESARSFGYNELVGAHRELNLWRLPAGEHAFEPAPGTCRGRVAVPRRAFMDGSAHNLTPIRPRLFFADDLRAGAPAPLLAYRRFRFYGMKCYAWDTWLTRMVGGVWTEPVRITENAGPPDARYAVAPLAGGELLVASPACDQQAARTFAEEAASVAKSRTTDAAHNHRVEIDRIAADETLDEPGYPPAKEAPYVIWPGVQGLTAEPLRPDGAPEDLQLVWADLHAHSAYSKCMSANDGLPEDVLRYQRDILGCRVLTLTEHVEYMSTPEFTHVLDRVEFEAGEDCVALYAVEWAQEPAHHTNFYAAEREVFEHLRAIILANHDLREIYPAIKAELPEYSVVAIRHFHGIGLEPFGTTGSRVTETHDPQIEWAMEAMQTRGNMMVAPPMEMPLFPSNFLNAGARIGIIGGSDHSRGRGPNRFCLTGLWMRELTGAGVLEAIRSRRTVGMANGKVALWAEMQGRPMGSEVEADGPVSIRAWTASPFGLRRACLIRDGELLPWVELDGRRSAAIELTDEPDAGRHWYCVTVEANSTSAEPTAPAHASPFFVIAR